MHGNDKAVIRVSGLYKDFDMPHLKKTTLKHSIINAFRGKSQLTITHQLQAVLQDISLEVNAGEFYGIVGRNGSGKSTLLKILAGIYSPTRGKISTRGRVVPFIELGVGFNGELTGRENIYLNGALLGYSRKEIGRKMEDILSFSELAQHIDKKLKNYSSGMQVRLAFSIATRLAESDILLIDEILAVGDADFQRKCFDYFRGLKKTKKTVILVTHDMNAVREYCDRAVLIDNSRIVARGNPDTVATEYSKLFQHESGHTSTDSGNRWGDGRVRYVGLSLSTAVLKAETATLELECQLLANVDIDEVIVGVSVSNSVGQRLFGTNTRLARERPISLKKGETHNFKWKLPNIFNDGMYFIAVAAVTPNGEVCDNWDEAASFRAYSERSTGFPVNPPIGYEAQIGHLGVG